MAMIDLLNCIAQLLMNDFALFAYRFRMRCDLRYSARRLAADNVNESSARSSREETHRTKTMGRVKFRIFQSQYSDTNNQVNMINISFYFSGK